MTDYVSFSAFLAESPVILGEGAVIERLRRAGVDLDPWLVNSALVYAPDRKSVV